MISKISIVDILVIEILPRIIGMSIGFGIVLVSIFLVSKVSP